MDQAFIQFLIGQVGLGGVAALALFYANRQYVEYARQVKDQHEQHERKLTELLESEKVREDILIQTLRGNTEALTGVQQVVARCGLVQPRGEK